MNKLFLPLFILCVIFCGACAKAVDTDPYNLSFDPEKHSWQPNIQIIPGQIILDSSHVVNGKHPFLIKRSRQCANWNTFSISQHIILPYTVSDTMRVNIHNSCGFLTSAKLYVWRYNDREEFISKDSININTDGWHTHTIMLPKRDTRILQLEVYARAVGQTVTNKELWNQPGFMQFLALDRIEVKIGSKDIAEFATMPEEKMHHPLKLNPGKALSLENITAQTLPMLKGKRIVALGETTHYNKTVHETSFEIIKSQILHNNCRMVILEMPYDMCLMYNYYVSAGKVTPLFSDIMDETMRSESSVSFREFLYWLRDYNKTKTQKVMLLGMDDCNSDVYPLELEMLDAAITLPSEREALADLFDKLANSNFIQAEQEAIKKREPLVELLGRKNYDLLSYDLHLSALNNDDSFRCTGKYYGSMDYRFLRRDSTMAQIAGKYLSWLDKDETACIYSHYLHLSRNSTLHPWLPLGHYLDKKYGADYFPLALLVGSGTNTMFQMKKVFSNEITHFDYTLSSPPANSLEKAAGEISNKRFFYPLDATFYGLSYIRVIGSNLGQEGDGLKNQFQIVSQKANIDGFIYIPKGTAYTEFPSESVSNDQKRRLHELRYKRVLSFKNNKTKK